MFDRQFEAEVNPMMIKSYWWINRDDSSNADIDQDDGNNANINPELEEWHYKYTYNYPHPWSYHIIEKNAVTTTGMPTFKHYWNWFKSNKTWIPREHQAGFDCIFGRITDIPRDKVVNALVESQPWNLFDAISSARFFDNNNLRQFMKMFMNLKFTIQWSSCLCHC